MEQQGVLRSWNDDKGFGFIRGQNGDYFVHISCVRGSYRPQQGETVFFVAGQDNKGRLRAEHMRSSELSLDQPAIRRKAPQPSTTDKQAHRPRRQAQADIKRTLILFIGVCTAPLLGSWQLFERSGTLWPLLIYIGMSLVSMIQYWHDKHNAQNGEWRTPETQLHTVELLGGWPGALVAQQLLRHKTRKASYQAVFWLIVLVHQAYWFDQLGFNGQLLEQLRSTF
ncbi:MAG TPA: cold shock and DUF1294 domain-containing protein [Thiopseudomonas sp.]|nr:cold shock and DUF1294 domain-containing protein [Thiopseudomonas sp.]